MNAFLRHCSALQDFQRIKSSLEKEMRTTFGLNDRLFRMGIRPISHDMDDEPD